MRALCPGAEREVLARLAAWFIRFTPVVSLVPPCSLLLDVAASLRLFGEAQSLLVQVGKSLAELGYEGRLALALTPLGALVVAIQAGGEAGSTRSSQTVQPWVPSSMTYPWAPWA